MLPSYFIDSLRRYTEDTKAFLTWLAKTSQRCGYDLSTATSKGAPPPKSRSSKNPAPLPNAAQTVALDIKHIVPLAEKIASAPKKLSKVPVAIKEALLRAIKNRERCNAWFEKHRGDDEEVKKANDGHLYFLNVLKQAMGILLTKADEEEAPVSVASLFEHLAVEDILGEEAQLLRAAEVSSQPPPASTSKAKNATQEPAYIVKEAEDDVTMMTFCILEDLARLRAFIRETWQSRKDKKISSLVASMVTQTALAFAKNLESEAYNACAKVSGWEEAVKLVHGKVEGADRQPTQNEPTNFPVFELTSILGHFRDMKDDSKFLAWISKYILDHDAKTFVASQGYVHKDDLDDLGILMILPVYRAMIKAGDHPRGDMISSGLSSILKTRRIDLWIVFGLQIFQDIHRIMKEDLMCGFGDLQKTAKRTQKYAQKYFEYSDQMQPRQEKLFDHNLKSVQETSTHYTKFANPKEDRILYIICDHPLAQGTIEGMILLVLYGNGRKLCQYLSVFQMSVHLYNTVLKTKDLKEPWPAMERAIEYFTPEKLFIGPRPENIQECLKRCELVSGASTTMYASDRRSDAFKKSPVPRKTFIEKVPVLEMLQDCYLLATDGSGVTPITQDLIESIIGKYPTGKYNKSHKGRLRKQWDSSHKLGPVQALTLLRDAIGEAETDLEFDFFGAHKRAWHMLRKVWKEFQSGLEVWFPPLGSSNSKGEVDRVLHSLPLLVLKLCVAERGPARNFGMSVLARSAEIMRLQMAEEGREAAKAEA